MEHCVKQRLSQLTRPTLLISAREDRIVDPHQAEEAAKLLPNGQFYLMKHCGHAPQMERSWLTNRLVLQFLTSKIPVRNPALAQLMRANPNSIL